MKAKSIKCGFTIVELVIITSVIALLTGIIYSATSGMFAAGNEVLAKSKAGDLEMAMDSFSLRVAGAESQWDAAGTQESKYALLAPYIRRAPGSFSAYQSDVEGFSLSLPSNLDDKVGISAD